MEERISVLEKEIAALKQRNKKVEAEKAWETSSFRVFSIIILTYLVMILAMWSIKVEKPYVNAIIPTLGFFLSTQSLPMIKRWWLNRYNSAK